MSIYIKRYLPLPLKGIPSIITDKFAEAGRMTGNRKNIDDIS